MSIEYTIKHAMPGRMRLHVPAITQLGGLAEACTRLLIKQKGVTSVRINANCASLVIEYQAHRRDVPLKLKHMMRALNDPTRGLLARQKGKNRKVQNIDLAPSSATASQPELIIFGDKSPLPHALALPTASLALSLVGGTAGTLVTLPLIGYNSAPIFKRALSVLRREHRLNVDFLDSLAIIISTLRGNLFTSAFITWLIGLGDYIRNRTAAKSKRAIGDLLDYQGQTAWVRRGKKKLELPVSQIIVGDTVIVYPGAMIPVDGKVIHGQATIDQKTITGESLPVERRAGDKVYASTVVREGKIYLRAERVGKETTAAQIVRLVEEAPIGETRIQNYAEKFADRLVAPSLAAALGLYAASGDVNRLLSMLIIDYGTGIRVAAPTSVLAVMTHAARQGILIKGGSQLEKLNRVDTIVFDKTGTLTEGQPRVMSINSYNERRFSTQKILALAAAAEARLTHPVAEAVLVKAREMRLKVPERDESQYHIGLGIEVRINGYAVHVGSELFLRERNIKIDGATHDLRWLNNRGLSALLLAVDGELTGLISYADQIRVESSAVIKTLHNRGLRNLIMLTGDNGTIAQSVAARLGLDRFFCGCFSGAKS